MDSLNFNFDLKNNYIINIKSNENNIDFFALDFELPGITLETTKIKNNKNAIDHIIKSKHITFDDIVIPFILDTEWETLKFFYKILFNEYLNIKNNENTGLDNSFIMTIYKTDSNKKILFPIKFYNTVIKGYSSVGKSSKNDDIEYTTFEVTFGYSYYEILESL